MTERRTAPTFLQGRSPIDWKGFENAPDGSLYQQQPEQPIMAE